MVNVNKLRGKIVECGLSIENVADAIGVHRSTFYRKLSGKCEVTIQDADNLVEVLGLTAEEAKSIFFSQFVAQTRQYRRIFMNELKFFTHDRFGNIRAVEIDGEPWFIGKDVAEALGYSNPRKALGDHVDDEAKGVTKRDTPGGKQDLTVINESGLYSLVLSSKLEGAKAFKRWITKEVIPSIRKHGAYMTPETIEKAITNPDFIIRLASELKMEQEKNRLLNAENQVLAPKALFADAVSASESSILIGDLAKLICQNGYGIGQKRLFAWLRDNGYLMTQGASRNMPKQRYVEQGLLTIKESSIANPDGSIRVARTTKVTGKGQVYFVNLFLNREQ